MQLRVHTQLLPEHDQAELQVNGIEVRRHQLPGGLEDYHRKRAELIRIAHREMVAEPRGLHQCLQPDGSTWESTRLLWAARRAGLPSVFYATMFPDGPPPKLLGRARYVLRMRALLSPFSQFIVSSERMKAAYRQFAHVPERRLRVLRNGVDLSSFSPPQPGEPEVLRAKLKLPVSAPIVLYSGSITPRKGVDLLLEAWPQIRSVHPTAVLVLLGSLGARPTFRQAAMIAELDAYTERIKAMLAGLPHPASVILPGEVDVVADYYRAADVFAFPSHREGLPNAVLEAMACGLPAVVAPFAGVPDDGEEFGTAGVHFVRSSHDPRQLADDVSGLLADCGKLRSVGQAARQWMEETQGMPQTLDMLAGFYREAARARR